MPGPTPDEIRNLTTNWDSLQYFKRRTAFADNAIGLDPAGCRCTDCCIGDSYPEEQVDIHALLTEAAKVGRKVIDRRP